MTKLPLRVDVDLSISEVGKAIGGKIAGDSTGKISGVCLDTRNIKKGDLFFALQDQRDGHEFVGSAFNKGAAAVVVAQETSGACVIRVGDPRRALGELARHVRRTWGKSVVGITGSNGKTTTKEMTAALLSSTRQVLKAPGTWNNALGVPLTLLMARPEHEVAVLELGISEVGEMEQLTAIAEPTVGVITNIGPTHLEKLGTLERVAQEKGKLFEVLGREGTAIVNLDDHHAVGMGRNSPAKKVTVSMSNEAEVRLKQSTAENLTGSTVELEYGKKSVHLESPFAGRHNVMNLLCACGVARALGVPAEKLQAGLDLVIRPEMRMEIITCGDNVRLINDCYNANPASMRAALEVSGAVSAGRHIAVLGDMMELGEYAPRAHRDIGIFVGENGYDHLFLVGQYAGDIAQGAIQGGLVDQAVTIGQSREELADKIIEMIQAGDVILIKGSRGMRMEEITARIIEKLRGQG